MNLSSHFFVPAADSLEKTLRGRGVGGMWWLMSYEFDMLFTTAFAKFWKHGGKEKPQRDHPDISFFALIFSSELWHFEGNLILMFLFNL